MLTKPLTRAALLVLVLVAVGCDRPSEPGGNAGSAVPATSSTSAPSGSSLDLAVAGWQKFTSVPGGYRLRYPPGWRAKERTGSGGPVLSLLPPKGAGISVLVTFTAPPEPASTLPDIRCRSVRIGGLEGSRCLDTVSMVVTTTLRAGDRWYVLTTSLRPGSPVGTYDRVVASFRLT